MHLQDASVFSTIFLMVQNTTQWRELWHDSHIFCRSADTQSRKKWKCLLVLTRVFTWLCVGLVTPHTVVTTERDPACWLVPGCQATGSFRKGPSLLREDINLSYRDGEEGSGEHSLRQEWSHYVSKAKKNNCKMCVKMNIFFKGEETELHRNNVALYLPFLFLNSNALMHWNHKGAYFSLHFLLLKKKKNKAKQETTTTERLQENIFQRCHVSLKNLMSFNVRYSFEKNEQFENKVVWRKTPIDWLLLSVVLPQRHQDYKQRNKSLESFL